MAQDSTIEWTDATWNPVTGCTKISPGCDNCYAERFSERFRGVPNHPFTTGFDLTLRPERLATPLGWKRPRMIFVNSMSDLFHKDIPTAFIERVFETMERAHWHRFQVLTKRSSLMRDFMKRRYGSGINGSTLGPANIWCGVSLENAQQLSRVEHLRAAPAALRFLSIEPLLGPIDDLDLSGIHWAILGGESGPRARPIDPDWVRAIRDKCVANGTSFFFKQWGGLRPKSNGRVLDGREWSEIPAMPRSDWQPVDSQLGHAEPAPAVTAAAR